MKYFKEFLKRGLIFGGFGPIILGIIYLIIYLTNKDIKLNGFEVFLGVISIYLLAFVHAGASVFNQIEEWSIPKSLGFHLLSLYVVYVGCYLINGWIPFDWGFVLVFTGIFLAVYFVIWLTVYLIVKKTSKNLNEKISR